jgi:hypothetical protein
MAWHWILGILAALTFIFVLWMFIRQMSTPTKSRPKSYASQSATANFAYAYVDWDHMQVSVLGRTIPFQTVDLTNDGEAVVFELKGVQDKPMHGRIVDSIITLFDANESLELHTASPRDLMKDCAATYNELNEGTAFRPSRK